MTPEIAQALEKAIAIWERRAEGEPVDELCPLCDIAVGCRTCPVCKETGLTGCGGTPFFKWIFRHPESAEGMEFAQQELEFLKSLREPEVAEAENEEGGEGMNDEHTIEARDEQGMVVETMTVKREPAPQNRPRFGVSLLIEVEEESEE